MTLSAFLRPIIFRSSVGYLFKFKVELENSCGAKSIGENKINIVELAIAELAYKI